MPQGRCTGTLSLIRAVHADRGRSRQLPTSGIFRRSLRDLSATVCNATEQNRRIRLHSHSQQQHVRHVRAVELNRDTASSTTVRVAGMSLSPLCLDYLSITPTEVIRPRTRVFRKQTMILPQSAMWFVSCIFNDPWSASIFACMIGHWLSIHGAIETAQL